MSTRIVFGAAVGCVVIAFLRSARGDDIPPTKPKTEATAGDTAKEVFGTIAEGYRTNRESFSAFSCRFKWTYGTARSIEAARHGQLEDKLEHDGLWLVDGQRVRHELVCTSLNLNEAFSQAAKSAQGAHGAVVAQSRGLQHFYLKNDRVRAHQSKIMRCINLVPVDLEDGIGVRITPFSLGVMGEDERFSPAALLTGVVHGDVTGHFNGLVEDNGTPLVSLTVENASEKARVDYRFDPERGYLPVHLWKSDPTTGKCYDETFILEARNCGSARWFPTRAIVVEDKDAPWPKSVRELRVTDLTLGPQGGKEFFLDATAGTRVLIAHSAISAFKVQQDVRINESQLESLVQRAAEHRAAREQSRKAEAFSSTAPISGGWPIRRVLFINGIVVTSLVAVFIWRKYKMRIR
jgi:hypothetical protein